MIDPKKLIVGFITYNSGSVISDAISPLYEEAKIVVLDNNSCDDTVSTVKSTFPDIFLKKLEKNVGFGRAVNRILRAVDSDFLLLLNPDVTISKETIAELLKVAEAYRSAWLIAPILYFADNRLQRSFLPFDPHVGAATKSIEVDHVIGAAMLMRRREIVGLGGFDEAFFLYGEDEDLCMRVRKAGGKVVLATGARAQHAYGASSADTPLLSGQKAWHLSWARVRVARKHRGLGAATGYVVKTSLIYFSLFLVAAAKGEKTAASACLNRISGSYAALRGRSAFDNVRL